MLERFRGAQERKTTRTLPMLAKSSTSPIGRPSRSRRRTTRRALSSNLRRQHPRPQWLGRAERR